MNGQGLPLQQIQHTTSLGGDEDHVRRYLVAGGQYAYCRSGPASQVTAEPIAGDQQLVGKSLGLFLLRGRFPKVVGQQAMTELVGNCEALSNKRVIFSDLHHLSRPVNDHAPVYSLREKH